MNAFKHIASPGDLSKQNFTLSNENAIDSAKRLYALIGGLSSSRIPVFLSGQHVSHHVMDFESHYQLFFTHLFKEAGCLPGIIGSDYGTQAKPEHLKLVNSWLIEYNRHGGIIQLDIHPENPWTGGTSWDHDCANLSMLLSKGNKVGERWHAYLSMLADGLQELCESDVPVLWRPLHECNTLNHWWWDIGPYNMDPKPYVDLWHHMYDYFTRERELNNLIWVFAPNKVDPGHEYKKVPVEYNYPGDDFVDVVGCTAYGDSINITQKDIDALTGLGKPFALTEAGPTTRDGSADLIPLLDSIKSRCPQASWLMFWHSWPDAGNPEQWKKVAIADQKNVVAFMNDPRVITREDLLEYFKA